MKYGGVVVGKGQVANLSSECLVIRKGIHGVDNR